MSLFSKFRYPKPIYSLLLVLIVVLGGCSLEKKNWFNRNMQNLTAHYNILFNAKEILRQKQESYATTFSDNYNEILSVYQDTLAQSASPDKDLESAIIKANNIINLKEQSHYQGDAYLVLGKANYLEGNFFNAVEYFNYVIHNYPLRADLVQDALAWKSRALIYLNQLPPAKVALDSAISITNPKKVNPEPVYAAKLQYDIAARDYPDGQEMAEKAIYYTHDVQLKLRLRFILAQLQELNQNTTEAYKNYTLVAKSNASFEMAFNASLNRIRMEDNQNGAKTSRIDRLLSLLKDPDNKEFKDQIYYQVAGLQMAGKEVDKAIKSYNLSVRNSVKNQNQKGLAYLRLAELYFKNKTDYLTAKKYYDSTLTSLPSNYPGYAAIQRKGNNLQILADRLQIITREDTLQALAKMDDKTRTAVLDKMVNDKILQQQNTTNAELAAANFNSNSDAPASSTGGSSTFYFYNNNAVSQGFSDFKKRWGSRKLEDNWRRSNRSNSDITNNTANITEGGNPGEPISQAASRKSSSVGSNYRQELVRGLPLTPALLAQSKQRAYNAYVDIANFYRDILEDKKEAITTFELILRLFPEDPNRPAIYYSLYRLYSDINIAKANNYKDKLIRDYADTPFAKIISDPDYLKKLDDKDAVFTQAYNNVFDLYTDKKYKEVIEATPLVVKQYPAIRFSAQLYYLKIIAEGHQERVEPFRDSLQVLAKKFPGDPLIAPLIKQHLSYIDSNRAEMLTRATVLQNDDPKEVPFTLATEFKLNTEYRKKIRPYIYATEPGIRRPEPKKPDTLAKPIEQAIAETKTPLPVTSSKPVEAPKMNKPATDTIATQNPPKQVATDSVSNLMPVNAAPLFAAQATVLPTTAALTDNPAPKTEMIASIFSMQDSTNYYFAVNVNSATTNLSSSRFGFGQFNRANYAGRGIRHELLVVGTENQLIYIGRFLSLEGAKKYARAIIPLLPEIMKVPRDKYSFFIITKENLDKLADKKTLDSYADYYQKNF